MTSTGERTMTISTSSPPLPRLHSQPTRSRRTLLDGGWWPRTTDPVTELPRLFLALDSDRSPVFRLMLSPAGWSNQPRRIDVGGRVVRLGWYSTQPAGLLTAIRADGDRVDLLVVPPDTATDTAQAAMALAAQPTNTIHAQHILAAVTAGRPPQTQTAAEADWESEGGHIHRSPADQLPVTAAGSPAGR
jgi:Family of unknown function (DUF5994)